MKTLGQVNKSRTLLGAQKLFPLLGLVFILALAGCAGKTAGKPPPSPSPGQQETVPQTQKGAQPLRLTLGEAVRKGKTLAAKEGCSRAVLWKVEGGRDFGPDGRAVWRLRLYDPAARREILCSFDTPGEPQVAVMREELAQPRDFPPGKLAPSEAVARRNPQIWLFVKEKEAETKRLLSALPAEKVELFRGRMEEVYHRKISLREAKAALTATAKIQVTIAVAPFMGPSSWYEHGKDAWVVSVDYLTEIDEEGRAVSESRRFWAALETGDPLYYEE